MEYKDIIPSSNVDIECLGKLVSITSPEAENAFVCQHEIASFREKAVQEKMRDALRSGAISIRSDPGKILEAEHILNERFAKLQLFYTESKNEHLRTAPNERRPGEDTFESRELEFESIFK